MRTMIRTYSDDIYLIENKTPEQIRQACVGMDWVPMPNGDLIRPASIASLQSYESYAFQADQKSKHKKGQFLKGGQWHDQTGPLGINAHLETITGDLLKLTAPKK